VDCRLWSIIRKGLDFFGAKGIIGDNLTDFLS
jgi:hypothetical protein